LFTWICLKQKDYFDSMRGNVMRKYSIKRKALSQVLACAFVVSAAPAVMAQTPLLPYSKVVVFGDSLSDTGNLGIWTNGATAADKKVWAQYVAAAFGKTITPAYTLGATGFTLGTGNGFAIGGAQTGDVALGEAPAGLLGTGTQVTNYTSRAAVDPKALHLFWIGGNNINARLRTALGAIGAGTPAEAAGAAAVTGISADAKTAATQVAALKAAGAKNIVVMNVPDLARVPVTIGTAASFGPLGAQILGLANTLSTTYNQQLTANLAGMNVIQFDTFTLFNGLLNNPAAYGITSATTPICADANACNLAASNQALFADGLHPTTYAHSLVGDWVAGALESTSTGAGISSTAATVPLGRSGAEWRTVDNRTRGFQNFGGSGKTTFFVAGDYADAKVDGVGGVQIADGSTRTGTIGFEKAISENTLLGITLGYEKVPFTFTGNTAKLEYGELMATGYMSHKMGNMYVSGLASLGFLDFDSQRNVSIGPLTTVQRASFGGNHVGVKVQAGYQMRSGGFVHGPFVGLDYERALINAFSENASPSAIAVGEQTAKQAHARVGYELATDMGAVRPYLQVSYDHQYLKNNRTFISGMASTGTFVPVTTENEVGGFTRAAAGFSTKLGDAGDLSVGVSSTFSNPAGQDTAINVVWSMDL
jgi:outer membrane lipase/esterase